MNMKTIVQSRYGKTVSHAKRAIGAYALLVCLDINIRCATLHAGHSLGLLAHLMLTTLLRHLTCRLPLYIINERLFDRD